MIERWIVIGGCPRSGTTLVGNALGAAEGAIVTPEAQFASEALAAVASGQVAADPRDIIAFIAAHWRFRIWAEPMPDTWPDLSLCKTGGALCSAILGRIVSDYANRHGKPGARIWIDHTPEHLRVVPDLLTSGFEVFGVHVIRDGRGVTASMKGVDWGPRDVVALADWWLARVAEGFAATQVLEGRAARIRFEDLLTEPEAELRRLCGAIGLDYTDGMLTSDALHVTDYTRPQHRIIGQRPDSSRAAAWRAELSRREQELFEAVAGDVLRLLGYPRLFPAPQARGPFERVGSWLLHNPARRRFVKNGRRKRRAALLGED